MTCPGLPPIDLIEMAARRLHTCNQAVHRIGWMSPSEAQELAYQAAMLERDAAEQDMIRARVFAGALLEESNKLSVAAA